MPTAQGVGPDHPVERAASRSGADRDTAAADGDNAARTELMESGLYTRSPTPIWIRGGGGAPRRARTYVLEQLDERISAATASDVALIVSELVTNSVVHANVGSHRELMLELTTLGDRLRVSVTDPGSVTEPRMLSADGAAPGGFGLRLVDEVSSAWGVVRESGGATQVWCNLPINPSVPL
jgi:anti-sigma regulatory factor (Ser/Thr protein kinase)